MGSPHKIIIHTAHSNLQYWKEACKISRHIAHEFLDLSEYDIVIKHIPGVSNVWADAHSWQADYTEVREDNNNVVVLPKEVFVNQITTSPYDVQTQCQKAQESNTTSYKPSLTPIVWNYMINCGIKATL